MILYRRFEKVYNEILKLNKDFGRDRKVETHLHTPASHDYRLIEEKGNLYYKNLKAKDILDIILERNYINDFLYKEILNRLNDDSDLKKEKIFKNYKEYLSYLLLIYVLLENKIEVVFVCDHNTIEGYNKLKAARDIIVKQNGKRKFIHIFLGVEISCADKNHVIGIIDSNKENDMRKYLNEIINDPKEGTYKTAYDVLNELNQNFNAITYIAHIDSADIFKSSGAYKKMLFSSNNISVLGLSDLEKESYIKEKLRVYTNQKINFIHDGDSHGIDTIGKKSIWIKFCDISFASLKKSFINFNTCVRNKKNGENNNYIKGIYIKSGQGFLNSKNKDGILKINFSKDLNCIIGGRGTGKSTILKIIELAFTLNIDNFGTLKVISAHDEIYIVFCIDGQDYILEIIPQVEYIGGKLTFADRELNYRYNNEKDIELNRYWRKLYSVKYNSDEKRNNYIIESIGIAEKFFTRTYSINQLINKIQNKEISNTIKEIILNDMNLESVDLELIRNMLPSNPAEVKKQIENINVVIELNKKQILDRINKFNKIYKKSIQIKYIEDGNYKLYNLPFKLDYHDFIGLNKTLLKIEDIYKLVNSHIREIGILKYIKYLMDKKYDELEKIVSIKSFKRDLSIDDVNIGIRDINENDIKEIYDVIQKKICVENIKIILEDIIILDAQYNLLFNISNRETNETIKDEYRVIEELSLGQQVAAILTFVINYGKFINDSSPLIIDQPEDNLDNQYIYKNLVNALKDIKNERQVIIATHSSTIVTNADAEQVIVMESDNLNGWIKARGYASDKKILKHIVNYMEGGKDSFNHKINIYSEIL